MLVLGERLADQRLERGNVGRQRGIDGGRGSSIRRYVGKGFVSAASLTLVATDDAFPGFLGGVFGG